MYNEEKHKIHRLASADCDCNEINVFTQEIALATSGAVMAPRLKMMINLFTPINDHCTLPPGTGEGLVTNVRMTRPPQSNDAPS